MKRFKQITFYIVLVMAVWHCFATFTYVSEGKFSTPTLNKAVGAYMLPWFHQDWKLFAPEPPLFDLYLYHKVQFTDGTWSEWSDPARKLISEHHKNRFGTAGRRYTIQDKLYRQLWGDIEKYEGYESYPEILTTTHSFLNTIKYYEKRMDAFYPERKVVAIRFAMVNVHFNEMKKRHEPKRVELLYLSSITKLQE